MDHPYFGKTTQRVEAAIKNKLALPPAHTEAEAQHRNTRKDKHEW